MTRAPILRRMFSIPVSYASDVAGFRKAYTFARDLAGRAEQLLCSAMNKRPKPIPSTWYCVHDLSMRQLYLGTDEAEASKFADEGTIIRSGPTRGDAMREAALAYAVERQKRFGMR